MSFQHMNEIRLTEFLFFDVLNKCLPNIRFDLSFQGFCGRKSKIVENIPSGDVTGFIFSIFFLHFSSPPEAAASLVKTSFGLC